jgi:hypothetical protein
MAASLPGVRSALLSAHDQVEELLDLERGRRPRASLSVMHSLQAAAIDIATALAHVDGLDALVLPARRVSDPKPDQSL